MKAISLWQPWASLWCSPAKVHETRHWPTRHRGPLIVHAAKRPIDDLVGDDLDMICRRLFGAAYRTALPRGALIGIVHITDCVVTVSEARPFDVTVPRYVRNASHPNDLAAGDWSEGRFAWRRDQFRVFEAPVPWRGAQGLFDVPDAIVP